MKKILIIAVLLMLLLAVFISCGRGNAKTTVIYGPGAFSDSNENESYAPVGSHNYYDSIYNFKSKVEFFDKKLPDKTAVIFGKTYKLVHTDTVKPQFCVNTVDFYEAADTEGKKIGFYVTYLSKTDKILGVISYSEITFEEIKKSGTKTIEEITNCAKEVLSRYVDLNEYECVLYDDRPMRKEFHFYKLLDGYMTREYIRVFIQGDGALSGIDMHGYGSYNSIANARFDKKAIEWYSFGNKIKSVTVINDEGDLVAEIKYWVTRLANTTTAADGSPHPTETVLLTRYVPLTKQSSASKITTAKATTAAPPIVTTPRTTELVFTTAPAEPLARPQG